MTRKRPGKERKLLILVTVVILAYVSTDPELRASALSLLEAILRL